MKENYLKILEVLTIVREKENTPLNTTRREMLKKMLSEEFKSIMMENIKNK